jgi:hypothetical protein
MTVLPKVKEWLQKQGFYLEMDAASAFRAAGFMVRQSSYYTDPETNKPREIDVEAVSESLYSGIDVRFFIECKSGDRPWVLLSSRENIYGYNLLHAFGVLSKRSQDAFRKRVDERGSEILRKFSWLAKGDVVPGYSLRQAFSTSKDADIAYTAAMTVTKACHCHLISHVAEKVPLTFAAEHPPAFCFAFPVIVVDQPLIQCTLNSAGEMELQEIEQGELLFTGHELGASIRIVTKAHLPTFAGQALRVAQQIEDELKSELPH